MAAADDVAGTWYINVNGSSYQRDWRRCMAAITGGGGGGGYAGTFWCETEAPVRFDRMQSIEYNASSGVLLFARAAPAYTEWHKWYITAGVAAGRFAHVDAPGAPPPAARSACVARIWICSCRMRRSMYVVRVSQVRVRGDRLELGRDRRRRLRAALVERGAAGRAARADQVMWCDLM